MDQYNLIIIGFIIAALFLAMWWAFNTVRSIETQKNFCALTLSNIAKLWRRANFVPENAKERESLYLYRDFLRKFDDDDCKFPIMVKDGGVRCMNRQEFDNMGGLKDIPCISILISACSGLIALMSILINVFVTKTLWVGFSLALIMPIVQVALVFFIKHFIKDKNAYRDGIFLALKENSVAFLRITKPFIIMDAYPHKFGKDKKSLYTTVGELSDEQLNETRAYIIRQKTAETEIVMRNVDNSKEIENINTEIKSEPQPILEPEQPVVTQQQAEQFAEQPAEATPVAPQQAINPSEQPGEQAAEQTVEQTVTLDSVQSTDAENAIETEPELTIEEKMNLISQVIDDSLEAEVERERQKLEQVVQAQTVEPTETSAPLPVEPIAEPISDVQAPAEDDFSLEAIGQALDAEIAKRKNQNH